MNRIARVLPILIFSLAFFGLAASAQAQADVSHSNDRIDVPLTIVDCNGATLLSNAEAHVTMQSVMDAAGGVHLDTHTNLEGKAITFVNDRPTLFIIHTTFHSTGNVVAASSTTDLDELHVSSSNNANNTVIRTFTHVTTNAKGEVTAVKMEAEADCRG